MSDTTTKKRLIEREIAAEVGSQVLLVLIDRLVKQERVRRASCVVEMLTRNWNEGFRQDYPLESKVSASFNSLDKPDRNRVPVGC